MELVGRPGSNDFHWMWVSIAIGQSNWPVELDLEELFFHPRAKGNEASRIGRTGQSNLTSRSCSSAYGQKAMRSSHWRSCSWAKGNESNWPVELDFEELFFHLRAKGNEIQDGTWRKTISQGLLPCTGSSQLASLTPWVERSLSVAARPADPPRLTES
jgi:hypothetical protein